MAWRLVLPWCPWLVAEAALGYVEAQLWPNAGLWLTVLWTVALILYRTVVAATERRLLRLGADAFFAGICIVSVFEGGWYVLPAVVAFAACDFAGLRMHLPSLPDDRNGRELGGALAATLVGWLGLAVAVSGPFYATATSVVQANGQVVDVPSPVGLLQRGMAPESAALLAAIMLLFGLLPLFAGFHVRARRPEARRALVAVVIVLTALALPALPLVGLWPMPGLIVAWLVVVVGQPSVVVGAS